MNENLPIAQKLQAIEAYLQNLTTALQQGKFPVNIQNISQVFDQAITAIPRINMPSEKFCDIYNDLPNILDAYAITVTLNADSYRQINNQQIVFERLYNGNYWIIPIAATPLHAWLVPNPTRQIDLTRLTSLPFAFDWPGSEQITNQDTFILKKPALVSTLPTTPLSWKLLKRGAISSFLNTDARAHHESFPANSSLSSSESGMVELKVKEHLAILENQLFDRLIAHFSTTHPNPPIEVIKDNPLVSSLPANSLGDLWRQSITDMMLITEPTNNSSGLDENIIDGELLDSDPANAQFYFYQAMEKVGQDNSAAALTDFNKAIASNSQYALAYFNRAILKQERLNDPQGALADYNQTLAINPQDANAYKNRAILKKNQLDDIAGAIQDFRQAATLYQKKGAIVESLKIIELLQTLGA
jgi:tetratricopeptide (TPR) repeat protein